MRTRSAQGNGVDGVFRSRMRTLAGSIGLVAVVSLVAAVSCGGRTLGGPGGGSSSGVTVQDVCRAMVDSDCSEMSYAECTDVIGRVEEEASDAGCDDEWRAYLGCLSDHTGRCDSSASYYGSLDDECYSDSDDLMSCLYDDNNYGS